jgi:predicted PurR-regulated permease PerM
VGAIVAGIPVVLVATTESWSLAGYALLAFVGIQMLEGYLLVPLVQGEAIRVPPAVILFSQILMGVLFGVVGIVLATPLVAALSVIHERWYVDAVLAEPATED